jgi:hypothetical protein
MRHLPVIVATIAAVAAGALITSAAFVARGHAGGGPATAARGAAPGATARIEDDPASIQFRSGKPDVFRMHGRLTSATPLDPTRDGVVLLVENAAGVLYRGALVPGDVRNQHGRFRFVDRDAPSGRGVHDGLAKLDVCFRKGAYHVTVRAYGEFAAAILPAMTVQLAVGDAVFASGGEWTRTRRGWRFQF